MFFSENPEVKVRNLTFVSKLKLPSHYSELKLKSESEKIFFSSRNSGFTLSFLILCVLRIYFIFKFCFFQFGVRMLSFTSEF